MKEGEIDTWYDRAMMTNIVLEIARLLTIIVATILVTRRYRKDHLFALRFVAVGFWLLLITVVFELADNSLSIEMVGLTTARGSSASASDFVALTGVLSTIHQWFNPSSYLLSTVSLLLLAYGVLRVRSPRHSVRGQSSRDLVPELAELRHGVGPGLRWLRHWLLENPNLDHDDEE